MDENQVENQKQTTSNSFEVYVPRQHNTNGKVSSPKVKLSKMTMVLDKTARTMLNNPEHVELAFDKTNRVIRITPSESGTTVKKTKVFAQGFYKNFEIDATGKYDGIFDQDNKALFVKLSA